MLIAKVIFLQAFWYLAVVYGEKFEALIFSTAFIFAIGNYFLFRPLKSFKKYSIVLSAFLIYGLIELIILRKLNLVSFESYPIWILSLYVVFIGYYGDVFDYLKEKPVFLLSLLGGFGGVLAFWGGVRLSGLSVVQPQYYIGIFISWSVFFPASLRCFYKL